MPFFRRQERDAVPLFQPLSDAGEPTVVRQSVWLLPTSSQEKREWDLLASGFGIFPFIPLSMNHAVRCSGKELETGPLCAYPLERFWRAYHRLFLNKLMVTLRSPRIPEVMTPGL